MADRGYLKMLVFSHTQNSLIWLQAHHFTLLIIRTRLKCKNFYVESSQMVKVVFWWLISVNACVLIFGKEGNSPRLLKLP